MDPAGYEESREHNPDRGGRHAHARENKQV